MFGFARGLVLRRFVGCLHEWIWVNAGGWALAMAVIYCGASLPQSDSYIVTVIVTGAVTGIVAGLAIGTVTGAGLVWMLRRPKESAG